jgi:hypothetical protein
MYDLGIVFEFILIWVLIFDSWIMFGYGVYLLLSWVWLMNNLLLNGYLVRFKTHYLVLLNMALVKFSNVEKIILQLILDFSYHIIFKFPYLIFEIMNYTWNIFLVLNKLVFVIYIKKYINILICIWPSLSKIKQIIFAYKKNTRHDLESLNTKFQEK